MDQRSNELAISMGLINTMGRDAMTGCCMLKTYADEIWVMFSIDEHRVYGSMSHPSPIWPIPPSLRRGIQIKEAQVSWKRLVTIFYYEDTVFWSEFERCEIQWVNMSKNELNFESSPSHGPDLDPPSAWSWLSIGLILRSKDILVCEAVYVL